MDSTPLKPIKPACCLCNERCESILIKLNSANLEDGILAIIKEFSGPDIGSCFDKYAQILLLCRKCRLKLKNFITFKESAEECLKKTIQEKVRFKRAHHSPQPLIELVKRRTTENLNLKKEETQIQVVEQLNLKKEAEETQMVEQLNLKKEETQTDTSQTDISQTDISQTDISQTDTSQTDISQTDTSQTILISNKRQDVSGVHSYSKPTKDATSDVLNLKGFHSYSKRAKTGATSEVLNSTDSKTSTGEPCLELNNEKEELDIEEFIDILRAFENKSVNVYQLALKVFQHKRLLELVKQFILKDIEARLQTQFKRNNSDLYYNDVSQLLDQDIISKIYTEMKERAGFLYDIIHICCKSKGSQKMVIMTTIFAMIMASRNKAMSTVQRLFTVLCIRYHADNKLLDKLNGIHLTLSSKSKTNMTDLGDNNKNKIVEVLAKAIDGKINGDNLDVPVSTTEQG